MIIIIFFINEIANSNKNQVTRKKTPTQPIYLSGSGYITFSWRLKVYPKEEAFILDTFLVSCFSHIYIDRTTRLLFLILLLFYLFIFIYDFKKFGWTRRKK